MTVRCPECGTINSGQSKFCSACGHQIRPQTAGRCPKCGAMNPANNIFCDECGHRLVPADPGMEAKAREESVRGLSLPRKEATTEDGVPDWLAKLRASFAEDEEGDQQARSEAPTSAEMGAVRPLGSGLADDSGTPSWLPDLSDVNLVAPVDTEDESAAGKGERREELPDWLREALGRTPSLTEEAEGEQDVARPIERRPADEAVPDQEPVDWMAELPVAELADDEAPPELADDQIKELEPHQGEPASDGSDREIDTPAAAPAALTSPTEVADIEPAELAGWLEALSADPAAEELETGEWADADEMSDWLQSVAQDAGDRAGGGDSGAEEKGLPDWLRALDLEEGETTAADRPPHWLEGLSDQEGLDDAGLAQPAPLVADQPKPQTTERLKRPQTRRPSTGPLVADELKAWLGDTIGESDNQPAASGQVVRGTGPLVPPELPEWLAAVEDIPATGELPGWLLQEEEEVVEEEVIEPEGALEAGPVDRPKTTPLPSWLKDDLGAVAAEDETEAVQGEIPDWLQPPPDMVATELARAELPSWRSPPDEAETPVTDTDMAAEPPAWPQEEIAEVSGDSEAELVEAVIPDWLQALKPTEATAVGANLQAIELEEAETEGPLAGVRGVLPIENAILTLSDTQPLPKFVVSEQQHDHVKVLQQIIHGGPEPKPAPASVRLPQWWFERGLIPIVILVAVFVPALLGYLGRPLALPDAELERTQVREMYRLVEALPESSPVVVAFDYSPASAGELDAVAMPLLRHLMMRQARIVVVSTMPAGPQLAQTALEKLAADYGYQYGQDYVILGYIPGGAVGLQAMATAPWELFSGADYFGRQRAEAEGRDPLARNSPAAAGLGESLRGSALILLLTAGRDDLVGWMEQVGRLPGMDQVPIVGGLSAGLEPWARPYYEPENEQLSGLVIGVPAAAEYARLVDLENTGTVALLRDSQTVGLAVVAVFVVIGLIWGSLVGLTSRSRSNG